LREKLNGALVTAAPTLPPSTRNWTLAVLEDELVSTLTVPETVAPAVGEVIVIVGGVDCELFETIVMPALVV